jgi:Domain of unknown function (DUF4926)
MNSLKLLDVVALITDRPDLGLHRGQVVTIVEVYEPGVFEVEFSDVRGQTYALATLEADQLIVVELLAEGTAFEVEFSDREGRMYESVGMRPEQVMVMHFDPASSTESKMVTALS